MNKVKYERPAMEIVEFDAEDMIVASLDDEVILDYGEDFWG